MTRRADGTLVLAVWNLVLPGEPPAARRVKVHFAGLDPRARARVSTLDAEHGSVLKAYDAMGRPRYPTSAQVATLRKAADLPSPQSLVLTQGELELSLKENALVVLELK